MDSRNTDMDAFNKYCQQKAIGFFKLLWVGTIKAMQENRLIALLYIFLFSFFTIGLLIGHWKFMALVILSTAIICGRWHDNGNRQRKQFFNDVFSAMKFKASDTLYPQFIEESEVSEYITAFSFNTLIPVSSWLNRKAELEMYFGASIVDIKQDMGDNRVVYVLVQTEPLPEYVEWNDDFLPQDNVFGVGISYVGAVGMDLEKYPHAFIAGETGSGKSNILKCMIYQALAKKYEVILIDFKRGVSFSAFSNQVSIYYDYPEVVKGLKDMVAETNQRLDRFRNHSVDNITDYNHVSGDYMKRKIVFIDELAELLKTRDKETANTLNDSIETLTRLSRAAGIHLIMGIQRPDSTIISGQIKNNVSFRVCGRFVDREPSRIMLSSDIASSLPNIKGRFVIKDDDIYEVQSFYFQGDSMSMMEPAEMRPYTQGSHVQPSRNQQTPDLKVATQPKSVKSHKATFADLFFQTREAFNQNDSGWEMCAIMTIGGQINPLLLACQRDEIRFRNPRELGLALLEVLLKESGISPSDCMVEHIQMTLQQLIDDGNEPAYSRQSQFVVETKMKNGEIAETPLLLMLALVTEFVCRSIGLGGDGSYKEKLYKLFTYEGKEPLTGPFFTIWAALAVATEFDEDLWSDYGIRLFDLKSGHNAAPISKAENGVTAGGKPRAESKPAAAVPKAKTNEGVTTEKHHKDTNDSNPIDFDFSGFGKIE